MSLSSNRTHDATHSALIDLMQEYGLKQIANQPNTKIRSSIVYNILDRFFKIILMTNTLLTTYLALAIMIFSV